MAVGVTAVALPAASAAASEGGATGAYGGYTAQQIADFLSINFSNTGGTRSLGFTWQTTSPTNNVAYTSSISGPITGSPITGTASGGTIPSSPVPGWGSGETLTVTLAATFPFVGEVTFQIDSNGKTFNWTVDGTPVTNPYGPYGGYTAQQIANKVGYTYNIYFPEDVAVRRLAFDWFTPTNGSVTYTASVAGPFDDSPWIANSSAGEIARTPLPGWDEGEAVDVTLTATAPFPVVVTFRITSTSGSALTSLWAVDGVGVNPPA